MTHHGYFNLAGAGSAQDHWLTIAAGRYGRVDAGLVLQDLAEVTGTPFDFRKPMPVGQRLRDDHPQLVLARRSDHHWLLDPVARPGLRFAARLVDAGSGRMLEIETTEPGMQFYASNHWMAAWSARPASACGKAMASAWKHSIARTLRTIRNFLRRAAGGRGLCEQHVVPLRRLRPICLRGRYRPSGSYLLDKVLKNQRTTQSQQGASFIDLSEGDGSESKRFHQFRDQHRGWFIVARHKHDATPTVFGGIPRQQFRGQLIECLDNLRAGERGRHDVTGGLTSQFLRRDAIGIHRIDHDLASPVLRRASDSLVCAEWHGQDHDVGFECVLQGLGSDLASKFICQSRDGVGPAGVCHVDGDAAAGELASEGCTDVAGANDGVGHGASSFDVYRKRVLVIGAVNGACSTQSAVSGWVSSLEGQIGVMLFDRSGRFPKLTPEGVLLLSDARSIVSGVDTLKARAKLMASGLEAELSVVVDVFFPTAAITEAAKAFASHFPLTPLRLFVEGLGAAYQPVLDGRCSLGILGALPVTFPSLVSERLGQVRLVMVAAPNHPLAARDGRISRQELAKHVQLVLTDRSELMAGKDYGVLSPSTWRLADLSTKHALLKDGVGWGSMPLHMVEQDIAVGLLVALDIEDMPPEGTRLTMSAVHPASAPPGPAGRWLIDRMKSWSLASSRPGAQR